MGGDDIHLGQDNSCGAPLDTVQHVLPFRNLSTVEAYHVEGDKTKEVPRYLDGAPTPRPNFGNKSEEEMLLKQLLVAIERLSTSLESMDRTNSAMLRVLVGFTKADPTPTPPAVPTWAYEDTSKMEQDDFMKEDNKGKGVYKSDADTGAKDVFRKLKDVSTIFISSDEDELVLRENHEDASKGMFVRGYEQQSNTNKSKSQFQPSEALQADNEVVLRKKPFSSDYRRGVDGQVSSGGTPPLASVRKLCFSPSETERVNKKSKGNSASSGKRPSPTKKGLKEKALVRAFGQTLPKAVTCKFKPYPNMKLSPSATNVAVYVFQQELDQDEVVFTVGMNRGTRGNFDSLCPGKLVTREIILMTSLKITCAQRSNDIQSVWCLPPSFADDVARGCSTDALINFYGQDWLGCYDHLRLVYLPIIDSYGHWFLMIISIRERKIFLMDSCLYDVVVDSRRYNIRKQAIALSAMIPHMYEGKLNETKDLDFGDYLIEQVRGIPKCVNSDTSGLWVAEWMHMQNNFTSNVIGLLEENHVGMEVAMRLLLDDNNECKKELLDKAANYWSKIIGSPII